MTEKFLDINQYFDSAISVKPRALITKL